MNTDENESLVEYGKDFNAREEECEGVYCDFLGR